VQGRVCVRAARPGANTPACVIGHKEGSGRCGGLANAEWHRGFSVSQEEALFFYFPSFSFFYVFYFYTQYSKYFFMHYFYC
jgi:hypothetical protein